MLQPRPETPRRTAVKYAVVALSASARADLRAWAETNIRPNGEWRSAPPARAAGWRGVVDCAFTVVDVVDRAWLRAWVLRWVGPDGELAVPRPHGGLTGIYPPAVTFGRRE